MSTYKAGEPIVSKCGQIRGNIDGAEPFEGRAGQLEDLLVFIKLVHDPEASIKVEETRDPPGRGYSCSRDDLWSKILVRQDVRRYINGHGIRLEYNADDRESHLHRSRVVRP